MAAPHPVAERIQYLRKALRTVEPAPPSDWLISPIRSGSIHAQLTSFGGSVRCSRVFSEPQHSSVVAVFSGSLPAWISAMVHHEASPAAKGELPSILCPSLRLTKKGLALADMGWRTDQVALAGQLQQALHEMGEEVIARLPRDPRRPGLGHRERKPCAATVSRHLALARAPSVRPPRIRVGPGAALQQFEVSAGPCPDLLGCRSGSALPSSRLATARSAVVRGIEPIRSQGSRIWSLSRLLLRSAVKERSSDPSQRTRNGPPRSGKRWMISAGHPGFCRNITKAKQWNIAAGTLP